MNRTLRARTSKAGQVPNATRIGCTALMLFLLSGLSAYTQQRDAAESATSRRVFKSFDAPGAGTAIHEGTDAPINRAGTITGTYLDESRVAHGFLRSKADVITSFDPASGASLTGVGGINAGGDIAGSYMDASGVYHGFVRTSAGAFTDIDAGLDATATYASAINDGGAVTGSYDDANDVCRHQLCRPRLSTEALRTSIQARVCLRLSCDVRSADHRIVQPVRIVAFQIIDRVVQASRFLASHRRAYNQLPDRHQIPQLDQVGINPVVPVVAVNLLIEHPQPS